MDTDSFTVYMKIEDIYVDIAKDIKTRFDTLKKSKKSKKIIRLMKDELRGKIIAELKYYKYTAIL